MSPRPSDNTSFVTYYPMTAVYCLDTGNIMVSTVDQVPALEELRTVVIQIQVAQSWRISFVPGTEGQRSVEFLGRAKMRQGSHQGSRVQG